MADLRPELKSCCGSTVKTVGDASTSFLRRENSKLINLLSSELETTRFQIGLSAWMSSADGDACQGTEAISPRGSSGEAPRVLQCDQMRLMGVVVEMNCFEALVCRALAE